MGELFCGGGGVVVGRGGGLCTDCLPGMNLFPFHGPLLLMYGIFYFSWKL